MYTRFRRRLYCAPAAVDVPLGGARQPADGRTIRAANLARDLMHGIPIAVRCRWVPSLDDIDAQPRQLLRDRELFARSHSAAGRLLAVAQRRIENHDTTVVECHALAAPGTTSFAFTNVIIRRSERPTSSMR